MIDWTVIDGELVFIEMNEPVIDEDDMTVTGDVTGVGVLVIPTSGSPVVWTFGPLSNDKKAELKIAMAGLSVELTLQ
jgi:hypothetical protein